MKNIKFVFLIVIAAFAINCSHIKSSTPSEVKVYFQKWIKGNPSGWGMMFYSGTDNEYHYFKCRPVDSWVFFKVKKQQINITDIRTKKESGHYYPIDPENGFLKINK